MRNGNAVYRRGTFFCFPEHNYFPKSELNCGRVTKTGGDKDLVSSPKIIFSLYQNQHCSEIRLFNFFSLVFFNRETVQQNALPCVSEVEAAV